ncbi:hypothetical protein J4E82_009325 [Alternaria postmessia]|uniref:uncharacterized protein n=1 Tax=Alternaria postmessia TaxID=1187938 RepID=UPI002225A802|nr:uncharacterized protein J4E82_009325 [Alternaria postmessia]KAI5372023.1 hypothetical protein J4E82_009325 [Alternaria postmessia]
MTINIETEIINTTERIGDIVDWLVFRHDRLQYSPTMYIDLEGVNLCREGSISILTLLIDTGISTGRVYLIDVHTLGAQAFNTAGAKRTLKGTTIRGTTLKDILQDERIPKVFFDVRNDSDALFAHFGVALQGVEDVQLMESATRKTTASRKFLNGLTKCVENNLPMHMCGSGLVSWKLAKEKGERLFKAEYGGSYDVFNQRPIPEDISSYCVGDVQYIPELRNRLYKSAYQWRDLVGEETKKRVATSQRSDYQPHAPDKVMAPWSKEQNMVLDQWNYVPPFNYFAEPSDSDDGYDGGPTNCRDIIDDYDLYYSD